MSSRKFTAGFSISAVLAGVLVAGSPQVASAAAEPAPTDRERVLQVLLEANGKIARTTADNVIDVDEDLVAEVRPDDTLGSASNVSRAASAALAGSDSDVSAFLTTGYAEALAQDERLRTVRLVSTGGPATHLAAQAALNGSDADVHAFLTSGWKTPNEVDNEVAATQLLTSATGPAVKTAARTALNGTAEDIQKFVADGFVTARATDREVRVTQLASAGGPIVKEAARTALLGGPEDIEDFLVVGYEIAQARDEEISTLTELVNQATAANQTAAEETFAAKRAADQAKAQALAAEQAAKRAADETAAAKDSMQKATAAAARAAEAAKEAAAAAQKATRAARAAVAAAKTAAAAAARASQAAIRASRASAKARQAARDAAHDKKKAQAAADAAKEARDTAKLSHDSSVLAGLAADAADAASDAADSATSAAGSAAEAGTAAATASKNAKVSKKEAGKAARASAQASRQAAEAKRAAKAATTLARRAATAAREASRYAQDAATHADRSAAAADNAAAHAGEATDLAKSADENAASAQEAATIAANAARTADEVEAAARSAEAEQLAARTAQSKLEALAALDTEQDVQDDLSAVTTVNLPVRERWDAATAQLLAEARQATDTATIVSKTRQAAVQLLGTDGAWTQAAAGDALAGTEEDVLAFLRTDLDSAADEDDRDQVVELSITGEPQALADTAKAKLDATPSEVQAFLRTRDYPGKADYQRAQITAIMNAGGAASKAAGNTALKGSDQDRERFLLTGQDDAAKQDAVVATTQVLSAAPAGSEVRGAAQAALNGPIGFVRQFLDVGQYYAQRRDDDTAVHLARVDHLLNDVHSAASSAQQNADLAAQFASEAHGWADKAQAAKSRAEASAAQAQTYANQAKSAATRANTSASKAATSASKANSAAATARKAEKSAIRSAKRAKASANRASAAAKSASSAAASARKSARAAGKSATEAANAARQTLKLYREQRRKDSESIDPCVNSPQSEYCRTIEFIVREMIVNSNSDLVQGIRRDLARCASNGSVLCTVGPVKRYALKTAPGAYWDHKWRIRALLDWPEPPNCECKMDVPKSEYRVDYDIWSNIHFGYVGTEAGIGRTYLQAPNNLPSNPFTGRTDPGDKVTVQMGIDLDEMYASPSRLNTYNMHMFVMMNMRGLVLWEKAFAK
ncbi:polymorphic toxin type 44 domain-containing protein [Actinoplanes philippinensis]|uniref:polymorphic toxin type 44 domain-containing protein n=1 Tax=Actinoplanes philippinensis TaxID=35752 RepID=UPI0033EA4EA4